MIKITKTAGTPNRPVKIVVSQLIGMFTPGMKLRTNNTNPPMRALTNNFQMILKLTLNSFNKTQAAKMTPNITKIPCHHSIIFLLF